MVAPFRFTAASGRFSFAPSSLVATVSLSCRLVGKKGDFDQYVIIIQKRCKMTQGTGTKSNRKPYVTYRTVPFSMTVSEPWLPKPPYLWPPCVADADIIFLWPPYVTGGGAIYICALQFLSSCIFYLLLFFLA